MESLNDGDSNSSSDSSSDSESEEEIEDDGVDAKELKQQLIDFLDGKGRGIRASSDTRDEVTELISQFESKNPTPAPTDSLSLLNGKWILLYVFYCILCFLLNIKRKMMLHFFILVRDVKFILSCSEILNRQSLEGC